MALVVLLVIVGTLPAVVGVMLPPVPAARLRGPAQAVVVLGAGRARRGESYRASARGLRRADAALAVAEAQRLPLLLSGGCADGKGPSEAALMAEALRHRWRDTAPWLEENSRTTWENARFSAALLKERGIRRVVLVTDPAHLCRAVLSFRAQGLEVEAHASASLPSPAWMPSAEALALVPEIYYEWLALLVYRLRHF
ncbi:YdcF family protein [Alcanivorax quisquiliarum]|uniref:YdcF family protein n=1 Tax=Alcanivorax quisquiliarum TaxID=2933565 RepID=A0ABT0E638_9GAMM|nr:YdcF family protein [Alcanivorax quisquiliarum]MCK0537293.1 YdcF family protein [Alcanivorax quisquiliarum]